MQEGMSESDGQNWMRGVPYQKIRRSVNMIETAGSILVAEELAKELIFVCRDQ